jgi:hypothetical protein
MGVSGVVVISMTGVMIGVVVSGGRYVLGKIVVVVGFEVNVIIDGVVLLDEVGGR